MSTAVVSLAAAAYELDLQDAAAVDLEIRRFVTGQTNGGAVLEALYGDVVDEPVPAALLQLLRG
jgi:hypothetical protein